MLKSMMEEAKPCTYVRNFSKLGAYQAAYTLSYTLQACEQGFALCVAKREGSACDADAAQADCAAQGDADVATWAAQDTRTLFLNLPRECAEDLLVFVYENAIPLESFCEIVEDLVAQSVSREVFA